jgi:membrane-associated protein
MLALLEEIVRWLGPVYQVAGYWVIGGATLAERSIFLGLFVPGDVIIALGGIYAARGQLSLGWVIAIGALAAISGESIGFWLGRRYGIGLIRRLPLANRLAGRLDRARDHFRERGGWTVAIGRYATAAGAFIPFASGLGGMPYGRFLMFDVPAVVVWAAAIALVGYGFGENLGLVEKILSRFGWAILGLLVAFFVARYVLKRRRQRAEAARAEAPEQSTRT